MLRPSNLTIARDRRAGTSPRPRRWPGWSVPLALWLLVLIATPIAGWTGGDDTFPAMATAGVIAQAAATLTALASGWCWRRILGMAAVVMAGAWGAEALGTATGVPFGHYAYTDRLWPQAVDVPLLIPLAWLMMLPPAWAITGAILGRAGRHLSGWAGHVAFAALSGLVFTAWDLYLDPQMVERELWLWDDPGGYFGIPWVNFLGWWSVATLLTLAVRPRDLPRRPLMLVYTLVWVFQAVGLGVFWGQPRPALAGLAGMGVFVVAGWWRELTA